MKSLFINAISEFNNSNYLTAIDIAKTIRKTSKEYAAAKDLIIKAYCNLGILFAANFGDAKGAEIYFKKCLELSPNHEDANNNLGLLFFQTNNISESIIFYKKALKVNPKNAVTLMCIGKCFERLNELDRASKYYDTYTALDPKNGTCSMSNALLVRSIFLDGNDILDMRRRTNEELEKLLNSSQKIENPEKFNGTYFYFSYHGICNKALNQKIAQTYLKLCPPLQWVAPHTTHWTAPKNRIKLGILSENLRQHSIGNTSCGLIKMIDRQRFEVIVIHLGAVKVDAMHERINESADRFVYIPNTSLQSARETVASLELDIAFWQDIGMNPFSYFLSFARLAPIQVTTFGHPDTTGIPNMDYFISSDLYETDHADKDYSEKLIKLPNAGTLSYYYKPPAILNSNRQDFKLDVDDHIFMCLQTLFKLHPIMDDIFKRISELDDKARFVFIDPIDAEMKPALTNRIINKYPELESKLVFIKHIENHTKYMQLLKCADVVLDPIYFNGQNTDLEAFSLDLPIVTAPTALQRGRHTLGMYKQMGFLDLVAQSPDDYADLAVKTACDPDFSARCKSEISKRKHVLYENIDFIRNLEKALTQMVEDH
jgi:protein O-GlcNAc transferase